EEVAPALGHRRGVVEIALVHLVDEPGVGSERLGRTFLRGHACAVISTRSYRRPDGTLGPCASSSTRGPTTTRPTRTRPRGHGRCRSETTAPEGADAEPS